ncbi:MAG: sulfurtransferase TusA family protein [Salinirussus sp.]
MPARVDVTGMACPGPVAAVRRRLAGLDGGEELVVVGDSRPAEASIRRACATHGFDVTGEPADADGEFRLRIRVTDLSSLSGPRADGGIDRDNHRY